jgi:hypothetical protein
LPQRGPVELVKHAGSGTSSSIDSSRILAHLPNDAAKVCPDLLHDSDVTCSLWGLARPKVPRLLLLLLWLPLRLLLLRMLLLEKAVSCMMQRAGSCSGCTHQGAVLFAVPLDLVQQCGGAIRGAGGTAVKQHSMA